MHPREEAVQMKKTAWDERSDYKFPLEIAWSVHGRSIFWDERVTSRSSAGTTLLDCLLQLGIDAKAGVPGGL
jgi:hypothetical protein